MLKKYAGFDFLSFTEKGWEARKLFAFKYDENNDKDERNREEEINSLIRDDLKKNLKKISLLDVGIIFTRACLYKQEPKTIPDTNQVGIVLTNKYKCSAGNTPIDYFYLIIQEESGYKLLDEAVLEMLKGLPGKWKQMSEQEWPGLFIGHYPKEPFMTERQREWSLNTDVREPLIKKLREQRGISEVHIIITRACAYTAEGQIPESIPVNEK